MPEMTPQQALDHALRLHQSGRPSDAESVYAQILRVDPRNLSALQMLARLYYETARPAQAAEALQRIIAIAPNNADALSNLGSVLAGLGRLDEAAAAVRKALSLRPDAPETHGNLANILLAQGDIDQAIALYQKALALRPASAETHSNLGNALRKKGDHAAAIDSYRRAVELRPDFVEARINLAHALKEAQRCEEAIEAYRQALTQCPGNPDAHVGLGNALQESKRPDEAIEQFRRALALQPDTPEAWYGTAAALKSKGETDQAIAALREAVRLRPTYADAYSNLGIALCDKGLIAESIAAYQQALVHNPRYAEVYNNLGITLRAAGRVEESVAVLKQALSIKPNYADALNNLALAYEDLGNFDEAIGCYRRAVAVKPGFAYAQNNLANALKETGRLDDAIEAYRRAYPTSEHPWLHGNLLFALHAHPDYGAHEILAEHRKWADRFTKPLASGIQAHNNDRSPERRLRIGFVSPDLNQHPVGRFLLPLFQNIDRQNFGLFCYSDGRREDWVADEFEKLATTFRKTLGLSDENVARLIRDDRIDILIDLAMHTKDSRLTLFGRRPAPVQATYLAYCSTTGVDTIDYRISDPYLDPPGSDETCYSEKTVRLPHTYWCYQSPPEATDVEPSPVAKFGTITFGCLNSFSKVTPQAITAWGRILTNVPGSRMVLHCREGTHRQRVIDLFRQSGVEPHRVQYVPRIAGRDYFSLYHQVDIALDPFPYPGGTTTCDALYMGVPVITLKGQTAVSRGGYSLLSNVGLPQFVAESLDQYVQLATTLANDRAQLATHRLTLRPQMLNSPLMNAPQFTCDFEQLLRTMWHNWVKQFAANR